jgi:hypothetical protein
MFHNAEVQSSKACRHGARAMSDGKYDAIKNEAAN